MSSKYSKIIYTLVTSSRWKYFFSISDDKNTVITWQEDPSGHISSFHCTSGTTTWIRVDPDVFKPKSESDKYEFLND